MLFQIIQNANLIIYMAKYIPADLKKWLDDAIAEFAIFQKSQNNDCLWQSPKI